MSAAIRPVREVETPGKALIPVDGWRETPTNQGVN